MLPGGFENIINRIVSITIDIKILLLEGLRIYYRIVSIRLYLTVKKCSDGFRIDYRIVGVRYFLTKKCFQKVLRIDYRIFGFTIYLNI